MFILPGKMIETPETRLFSRRYGSLYLA